MKALVLAAVFSSFTCIFGAPAPDTGIQTTPPWSLKGILFPNYLVPIKEAEPDTAFNTQYTGQIHYETPWYENEVRLLVGFDVPRKAISKCLIKFTLPKQNAQQGGYKWTVNGSGKLDVWSLHEIIEIGVTTWKYRPKRTTGPPQFNIKFDKPFKGGDALVLGDWIPCKGGQRMDFEVAGARQNPVFFDWYELTQPKTGITLEMY